MENKEQNSNFLQSAEWRRFQESVGRKTFFVENGDFSASLIEHELPVAGKYLYIPHGPIFPVEVGPQGISEYFLRLIDLAKKENTGWIRIEPENKKTLEVIKNSIDYKIKKAPHDMQPKEIFVIDILKSEEALLAEMKQKTRYNIRLAEKKNIKIFVSREKKYIQCFCELVKITAKRDKVSAHPENYYRKMIEFLSDEMLKIYVAEYDGKIIAANLMLFYGDTATYLHGASGNEYRNVMAPYLLQWQAILDAKKSGFKFYDFGGVKTREQEINKWSGITKFKLGFSLNTQPVVFSGSYDIIISKSRYFFYRILQKLKNFI